ncbi:MAG: CBS domain-containing protein [Acidiferrobacterales bacterium]|nr:CBS domain-containing protein [Acidiferrobacterales bacterium]
MKTISTLIKARGMVWTVTPENTVLEALHVLAERNIGAVPVISGDELVGIFSERDYARRVILQGLASKDTLIADVMTENVQTVNPDDNIEDCMKIVVSKGFRHLPVVEDGELIGVVSANDLLAEVIRSREMQMASLENLLSGAGEIT